MEKVIIVGSGCAGLTAAIYAARANLSPLVLEGRQPGGQLSTTTLVENYPGFPDGIDGPELILNMHRQAEKFGARFSYAEVTDFDPSNKHIRIMADDEWLDTRALIIASGAAARYLGLDGEEKLVGHGLTSCATCDGAFYKNVPVCVVGGGDSAAEESLFLTRFASKVYLIHRRDKLRASKIMQERVFANKKIEPIWDTVVTQYTADEKGEMRAVRLRNVKTNDERELDVACVFVAIGHDPNTKAYRGKLDMDSEGYLIPKNSVESKYPGVFIAGDVADRVYKQAITAAGMGCAAALQAEKYLSDLRLNSDCRMPNAESENAVRKADLKARTKQFALRVMKMVDALPRTIQGRTIAKQIIRSATSVAANYRAACRARSRAEFIAKIGVVEEEADESCFWLELIIDSGLLTEERIRPLLSEAGELVAIMAASRKSAIGNRKSAIK